MIADEGNHQDLGTGVILQAMRLPVDSLEAEIGRRRAYGERRRTVVLLFLTGGEGHGQQHKERKEKEYVSLVPHDDLGKFYICDVMSPAQEKIIDREGHIRPVRLLSSAFLCVLCGDWSLPGHERSVC